MATDTLVIYDDEGHVIQQLSGTTREPVGIPFKWVEVPAGKYIVSIDVSEEIHVAVFGDVPKSTGDELDEIKQSVMEMSLLLATLLTPEVPEGLTAKLGVKL